MNIQINFGSDVFVLPRIVADNLSQADSTDLKTLLLLASDSALRKSCDIGDIAKRIGCRRDKAEASIRFWCETGVISQTETAVPVSAAPAVNSGNDDNLQPQKKMPTDEIPAYSGDELQKLLDENTGSRRHLLDECQNIAGKMFNVLETNKVIALSDYLGLENEHILMLFAYCQARGKTSVHYIEHTAYNLYNEGIDSLPKLETYIKGKEACESAEGKLRALFGFGERTLTPNERGYIKRWTVELGYAYEIIERAYQITADNTHDGKISLAYMNKILENWHTAGYTALAEIDAALEAYKTGKVSDSMNHGSFETDEFISLALKRSYGNVK